MLVLVGIYTLTKIKCKNSSINPVFLLIEEVVMKRKVLVGLFVIVFVFVGLVTGPPPDEYRKSW